MPGRSGSRAHRPGRTAPAVAAPPGAARSGPRPDRGRPGQPRVVLLARDGRGWAALCRLISATHLAGERGAPVSSLDLVAEHAGGAPRPARCRAARPGLRARPGAGRPPRDLARAHLDRWREVLGRDAVVVEVVHHRGPGDAGRAARMLGFATERGAPAVLTNVVRYADRSDAPTADVLDAARRLVALDARHVDRINAEAAPAVRQGDGRGRRARSPAPPGWATTGAACWPAPAPRPTGAPSTRGRDLGIGEVHFPELEAGGGEPRRRCCASAVRGRLRPARDGPRRRRRWPGSRRSSASSRGSATPSYFLTVADVVDLIKGDGGAGRRPRERRGQPGHLPARHLRRRPDPLRPADGALPVAAAPPAARHRRRRRVGAADGGLRADPRAATAASAAPASR